MIIAFSGASGSGKTTQLKKIKNWDYLKNRKVVVKDEDDFRFIKIAKSILGEDKFTDYKDTKMSIDKEVKKKSLFSILTNTFYPIVVYLEFLADYLIYEIFCKKKILLKDRYIFDYLVTFENNLNIKKPLVRFFYTRFPLPYLLFYIDTDVETLLERNKNKVEGKITNEKKFHESVLRDYKKIAEVRSLLVVNNKSGNCSETIKKHIENKEKLRKVKRVVITGLDGSGKTTLANNFTNYLSKLNIRWKVAHFYHDNMLHKFLKMVGYYKTDETEEEIFERSRAHNIKVKKEGKPFIWGLLHYIDSYIQLIFFNIFYFNRLIIYDRYFYDFLVSFEFLRVPNRDFFEKLIIPIKNNFLLIASPEVMYERKPETTIEFATEHYDIYHKLTKKYDLTVINSEKNDQEKVLSIMLDKIST